MPDNELYDDSDQDAITALPIGRKVVRVSLDDPGGTLTLDDGTVLEVSPNRVCGCCGSGWHAITQLNRVDHAITSVEFDYVSDADRIFAFADNERINLLTVEGDDGNGYYDGGFEIVVRHPERS